MPGLRRSIALAYDDVLLVPNPSFCKSTNDGEINFDYGLLPRPFSAPPLINAPMDTVCSPELLQYLHDDLSMAVTVHRFFKSCDEQLQFIEDCEFEIGDVVGTACDYRKVFVSVGSFFKWKKWIDQLLGEGQERFPNISFLVDMANGGTLACVETVKYIRKQSHYANIMAGNVSTPSQLYLLEEADVNFARVGIGGGSICTTRKMTGFGYPTFASVMECAPAVNEDIYLVADGGIEYPGDVCKSIAVGASMGMVGKVMAATSLSAGIKLDRDFKVTNKPYNCHYIIYRGMASKEVQAVLNPGNTVVSIEGVTGCIEYKGDTSTVIPEFLHNLKASMTYYGGCRDWLEFQRKVECVEITNSGLRESEARVLLGKFQH